MSTTSKIILVNITVFIFVMIFSIFNKDIFNYVALNPSMIVKGDYLWTLLTSMFAHAGFAHLFFNMISLYFVGSFAERIIGKKRFFYFYMVSGVLAGLFFSLLAGIFGTGILARLFGDANLPGVGASGAIFGIVGLIAVLTPRNRVYLIAGPLIAIVIQSIMEVILKDNPLFNIISIITTFYIFFSIFVMFSFNTKIRKLAVPINLEFWILPIVAIVPLIIIGMFFTLPIGNMAHLGGLIAGLIYGAYLRKKHRRKINMLNKIISRNY